MIKTYTSETPELNKKIHGTDKNISNQDCGKKKQVSYLDQGIDL